MKKAGKIIASLVSVLLGILWMGGTWAIAWEHDFSLIEDDTLLEINVRGVTEDLNTVVGFSENGGFTYDGTSFTSFADGSYTTRPLDACTNASGDDTYIVGYKVDEGADPNFEIGFLYTTSGGFELRDFPGYRSIVNGVNSDGVCVGVRMTGTEELVSASHPVFEGYIHDGIEAALFSYPDAEQTVPWGINDNHDVVGFFYEEDDSAWHAFKYTENATDPWETMQIEYQTGVFIDYFPTSINNNGDCVGYFITPDSPNGLEPVLMYYSGNQPLDTRSDGVGIIYLIDSEGSGEWGNYFYHEIFANTRLVRITDDQHILGDCPAFRVSDSSSRSGFILTRSNVDSPDMPDLPEDSPTVFSGYITTSFYVPNCEYGDHALFREINNAGEVVGSMPVSTSEDILQHPFYWDGVSTSTVDIAPEYGVGVATDINDNGVIAGYLVVEPEESDHYACIFTKERSGSFELEPYLDEMPLNISGSIPIQILINNNNEMAAAISVNTYLPGVLWERGQFASTARPYKTRKSMVLTDMNNYGRIAGVQVQLGVWYLQRAAGVIWDKSQIDGDSVPWDGAQYPMIMAINDSGTICCNLLPATGNMEVFSYTVPLILENIGGSVVTHTLQVDANYDYAVASDINDDGTVVGRQFKFTSPLFESTPCIWERNNGGYGTPVLLQDYVASPYTLFHSLVTEAAWEEFAENSTDLEKAVYNYWTVFTPNTPRINDNGQILMNGRDGDGNPVGLLLTPIENCEEETGGNLDVIGQPYCSSGLLEVPVQITDAPNDVDALGFEVTFDPELLQFESVITDMEGIEGEILGNFDYWDANLVSPGVVRIGAYTLGNPISMNTTGILAYVRFSALSTEQSQVGLQNLIDDLTGWTTTSGCLTRADGDVNGDGDLTPLDALCALEKASLECDTSCGPCESTPCDVNMDCDCTASDSVCILNKYLELASCLDDLP